jgi:hypothetical protein
MDKSSVKTVVRHQVGGLEFKPVFVDDIFYHDYAGKVFFRRVPDTDEGVLELAYVDAPEKTIEFDSAKEVLKSASWMEKEIPSVDLAEMLTAIDNAGHVVAATGGDKLQEILTLAGIHLERLARTNKSWRDECLSALDYASSIEMLVSSMFSDVVYFKADGERIGHVLVNIKKLAMLLNDKHRTLEKAHAQLTERHLKGQDDYDTLNDRFATSMLELKTEKLSQQIIFNSVLAPKGYDLDSAAKMLQDKIKTTFLDEVEAKLKEGQTLDQIRSELEKA